MHLAPSHSLNLWFITQGKISLKFYQKSNNFRLEKAFVKFTFRQMATLLFRLHRIYVSSFYMMTSSNGIIFPRYWPFVRGIHRPPVNSPHKGQWRGALMFFLICAWINGWVNNREAGDLKRHRAHYDVIVMIKNSVAAASHYNEGDPWIRL